MSYKVLARKWRPNNFSELIGQDQARRTLSNALKQERLYPVLIFTGPRGTGKTSTARIVAKNLKCQKSSKQEACNLCEDCRLIADSRHLDVIEIDGASNNGVDAVRELREGLSYLPNTGKWKIYIIDEVHMLTNSAFNALLKTLEEPPPHVMFIMATTESHKIPQTVLSRGQKIDFHLLSPLLIKEHLEKICQKESFALSESSLWLLAKQAQGSLRDAQSLLDQVLSFCGEELSETNIRKLLGLSDSSILSDCVSAIINRKESQIINSISLLRQKGIPSDIFLQNLISSFSQLLFLKKNPSNQPPLVQASKQDIASMIKQSEPISYEELHFLLDMLLKGEKEMKFCHDSELLLEVLLLRFCSAPRLEEFLPFSIKTPSPNKSLESKKPLKTEPEPSKKKSDPPKTQKAKVLDQEKLFHFVDHLKKKDPSLSAFLENLCWQKEASSSFRLMVPASFSYLKDKITPSLKSLLEQELSLFLGLKEKASVRIVLADSVSSPGDSLKQKREKQEQSQLNILAESQPFVKKVKNVFSAKLLSVTKLDKKAN